MKKGKSFVASILVLISIIAIMALVVIFIDSFWGVIIGAFLCGVAWLFFETLESKGAFAKVDEKIYSTSVFKFLQKRRTIVYFVLFSLGLLITLFIFS